MNSVEPTTDFHTHGKYLDPMFQQVTYFKFLITTYFIIIIIIIIITVYELRRESGRNYACRTSCCFI
jgi:hypothetical protein